MKTKFNWHKGRGLWSDRKIPVITGCFSCDVDLTETILYPKQHCNVCGDRVRTKEFVCKEHCTRCGRELLNYREVCNSKPSGFVNFLFGGVEHTENMGFLVECNNLTDAQKYLIVLYKLEYPKK
jgi:predicted nucleic acid-binding Zn ribbon protein